MLQLTIPGFECYDEASGKFIMVRDTSLQLEHSLVSISRWESKWNKPFLGKEEKSVEQCEDYVRCMTITQNVNPLIYSGIRESSYKEINDYIDAPMTATWFSEKSNKKISREVVTAEIIYYWMIELGIPFECQKWHLNRLLTLIRVCNIKNTPSKKMSKREILGQNRALNAARKKRFNTRG